MDNEAVGHLHEEGRRNLALLQFLLILTSIANVEDTESPASGQNHETFSLRPTLILLCSTLCLLTNKVDQTGVIYRAITIAAQATYQILNKLQPDKYVYCDPLNSGMKNALQMGSYPFPADILLSKMSAECSMHGVLNNLAVRLISDIHGLLNLPDGEDIDSLNSRLDPLLESLNCTLGSLNRALDPLPGGKYAMEAELYNVHLTPHKLPVVKTLISEPAVNYCCCSYKQLTLR